MEISAAMLQYALAKRHHEATLKGAGDLVVARVRLYRLGAREQGTLYMADTAEAVPEVSARAGYAVMCLQDEIDDAVAEAYDALRELEAWEGALKEALLQGASPQDFIDLGRDMLGCPLAYFDRNLIVLAASADYWEAGSAQGSADVQLHAEGQMPPSRAADLIEDVDYLHAADLHGGFYYESSQNRQYFGVNTFDQGEYLARLIVALPEEARRLHPGQEQLVGRFHALLDDLHLRYAGNTGVVSSQNDALHELVRRMAAITALTNVDLDDPDQVLHLLLSAKLLGL